MGQMKTSNNQSKEQQVRILGHRILFRDWLIACFGGLAILHLNLTQQMSGQSDLSSSSLLFWFSAFMLLWQKRAQLNVRSDRPSNLLGTALLTLVFYKSLHLFTDDSFLRIWPLLSVLGWALIASGAHGLKQYKKELFLLSFLAIPWEFVYLFDISLVTAKFSAFVLWLLGFEVVRQGVWIILPTGSIEVYNGCSGIRMIFQLLGICWLILALMPEERKWTGEKFARAKQTGGLVISAIAVGFIVNGVRVALMAALVALSDTAGFDYWHTGNGSLVFSAIAVLLFVASSLKLLTVPILKRNEQHQKIAV